MVRREHTRDLLDSLNMEKEFRSMVEQSFDNPSAVGPDQEREMRRAFFGGAVAALGLMQNQGVSAEELQRECQLFVDAVIAGFR